jgi:hydrogenase expression/formation protein HypD
MSPYNGIAGTTTMKYVDEFRDRAVAAALAERIKETVTRPWTVMEVCGGQTHSIVRSG